MRLPYAPSLGWRPRPSACRSRNSRRRSRERRRFQAQAPHAAFFEFLSITDDGQGLVYTAWPRGGAPTAFRRTRGGGGEIVFENPSHDFPKRMVYRREADGGITTRVEGDEGGVPHVEEQRLYRVGSPASAR